MVKSMLKDNQEIDFYKDTANLKDEDYYLGKKGYVFNIQRFTVHDGPGIRTEIFLKGCGMRCSWCFNPESFHPYAEVGVFPKNCIGTDKCNICLQACPLVNPVHITKRSNIDSNTGNDLAETAAADACQDIKYDPMDIFIVGTEEDKNGKKRNVVSTINRDVCTNCMKCAEACPAEALKVWGSIMTVEEVMKEVLKERLFYEEKGGGITISGGEVLIQWKFALELLKASKRHGIHTCIETTLNGHWDIVQQLMNYTDFIFTDIKHMNSQKHREYTGVSNDLILENIKKVAQLGKPMIIRIPIIPEHNDSEENIKATAEFIVEQFGNSTNILKQVQLLTFHRLGGEKYNSIGMPWPMEDFEGPSNEEYKQHILHLNELMKSYGLPAVVGSTTKY